MTKELDKILEAELIKWMSEMSVKGFLESIEDLGEAWNEGDITDIDIVNKIEELKNRRTNDGT